MSAETNLVRYYKSVWKRNDSIFLQRPADNFLLISEGYTILNVPLNHELFDSREIFPFLPEKGKEISYRKDREPLEKGPNLRNIATLPDGSQRVTLTAWQVYAWERLLQVLALDGKPILINTLFTNLLPLSLDNYTIYAEGIHKPVYFILDKQVYAVFMPMSNGGLPELPIDPEYLNGHLRAS